ncbi:MAG TPA: response regulator transcription factor [Candidatus Dormibacteraeota bacterium]
MTIRVVLAEDDYLVREGVKQLLGTMDEFELLAAVGDLPAVERAIAEYKPDVVLTDIRMPPTHGEEGLRLAESLRRESPKTGVVVLSQYVEPQYALSLLQDGAAGRAYLLKERIADIRQLANALREVAAGGSVIDPKVVEALVDARSKARESALRELTPREMDVLRLVAEGKNNAGIAEALFLTERAVEKHINSIFSKLELGEEPLVHRRVKATLTYLSETGSLRP